MVDSPTSRINDYIKSFNDDLNQLSGDFDLFISPLKTIGPAGPRNQHTHGSPFNENSAHATSPPIPSTEQRGKCATLQPMEIVRGHLNAPEQRTQTNKDFACNQMVSSLCIQLFQPSGRGSQQDSYEHCQSKSEASIKIPLV